MAGRTGGSNATQNKVHFGGMWVFPGGRVDDEKRSGLMKPRSKALNVQRFVRPRRSGNRPERCGARSFFPLVAATYSSDASTHFFLAKVEAVGFDIQVDGGEITEHQWVNPDAALEGVVPGISRS